MLKILVIDLIEDDYCKDESLIFHLTELLDHKVYDIFTANIGDKSLLICQQEQPEIVIIDLDLHDKKGLEFLKCVKKLDQNSEIIILTTHIDINPAIEALHNGASDFILKPVTEKSLIIAIKRAKDKIDIKQLRDYTDDLENMIKIASEEVRAKSEFQAELISSSHNGIVATDEYGKIIIYNPAAESIFGYSRNEVINRMNAVDFFPANVAEELYDGLNHRKNLIGLCWEKIIVKSKNGEDIPVKFSLASLLKEKKVVGCVAYIYDLREIKRLEMELLKSERLAAVGQTVAGLAHYIKNILSGLKGGSYVVNIGFDKNDTDKMSKGWKMIQKNINRISDLVMNLLTYSKIRKPEYIKCSPNEIVIEVCDLMQSKAVENDIEIIKELDFSIGDVIIDSEVIHRSLLNLVSNAIDACIFDENKNKKYHVIVKTTQEKSSIIRFDITDNGCGMSDEVKSQLFTTLFTTKLGKGNGIGLLVSKKILEEHDGEIYFITQEGVGSTFTIKILYWSMKDEVNRKTKNKITKQ